MLTAETISAARARSIGLVHEAVSEEAASGLLAGIVEALLRCAPGAQMQVKTFIARDAGLTNNDGVAQESRICSQRCAPPARDERG